MTRSINIIVLLRLNIYLSILYIVNYSICALVNLTDCCEYSKKVNSIGRNRTEECNKDAISEDAANKSSKF